MKKAISILRVAFAVILIASLSACVTAPATGPKPPSALRVYVFNCGTIDVADISVFHPGVGKDVQKRLTDSCYLIVHPKGTLMWDTGLPDSFINSPQGKTLYELFTMRVTKTLASQLQEIGYAPDKIDYLGISHMHSDHIGNVNLFPHATLLIQKEEYAAAFSADPKKFGFNPADYPTLQANPVKLLEGDYDVFGDGSVIIKRTLGHTPGHQALFLKLPKTGNVLLSGDLVHFTDNWVHKYVPGFNYDKAQSLKTMEEVARFLEENHAVLWIQHDLEQNQTIAHSPKYYE